MLTWLLLVFLLVQGGIAQLHLQNSLNEYIGKKLNDIRQTVANGSAFMLNGHLPSSLSMFKLTMNSKYQMLAQLNSMNCTMGNKYPPIGHSINFFVTSYLPTSITGENVADVAIGHWAVEPYVYGIGEDLKYTDTKLKDFANMVYYKSTEFGCHYTTCNLTTMPPMNALACVFNNAPEMNEPLYVASGEGQVDGCNFDSDCEQYVPFAKCATSDPNKGLCYTTNDTNFITSTTMSTKAPTTTEVITSGTKSTTVSTSLASTATRNGSSTIEAASTASNTTKTASTMITSTTASTASSTTRKTTSTTQTTSTAPATTTIFDPMTEEIRTNLTNMHNYRRSRLAQGLVSNGLSGKKLPSGANINQLTYSTALGHDAQAYANTCPLSGSEETTRMGQGENFATISTSKANSYLVAAFRAVQSFWHVIKSNSINEKMMFTESLLYRPELHSFTQMAWASTTQFGCGVKLCGSNYVVVCRYSPRGNVVNQNIYNVGKACSHCPTSCTTAYLYKGLCI